MAQCQSWLLCFRNNCTTHHSLACSVRTFSVSAGVVWNDDLWDETCWPPDRDQNRKQMICSCWLRRIAISLTEVLNSRAITTADGTRLLLNNSSLTDDKEENTALLLWRKHYVGEWIVEVTSSVPGQDWHRSSCTPSDLMPVLSRPVWWLNSGNQYWTLDAAESW